MAQNVANSLRGRGAASDYLVSLHRTLMSHQNEILGSFTNSMVREGFRIPDTGYGEAVDVDPVHLNQIEKLSRFSNNVVETNYLKIAVRYIVENAKLVESIIKLDNSASLLSLTGNVSAIRETLDDLQPVDRMSLHTIRLYSAFLAFSDDLVRDHLANFLPSHWTRTRLLYPLIYYTAHVPDESSLQQMLEHYFPSTGTGLAERKLARFLLQPENPASATLAMRCYVALLSHPYDALEYIVTDVEHRLASGADVGEIYANEIKILASKFPQHRIARLWDLLNGAKLPLNISSDVILPFELKNEYALEKSLNEIINISHEIASVDHFSSPVVDALLDLRFNRYPNPSKFDEIYTFHKRFSMLSSGRLVKHIASSLYLFFRESEAKEQADVIQCASLFGCWTPLSLAGPGGYMMIRSNRISCNLGNEEMLKAISILIPPDAVERRDRLWIVAANWRIMEDQLSGRLKGWLGYARSQFPVHVEPRYLSGLSWRWLDDVIAKLGIGSVRGDPDTIHVFFLKLLEEFRRESVPLRISFEPIARKHNRSDRLYTWLAENFGASSGAFVRFFLSADTVLKLKLADNYVAAVSFRIDLLVKIVEHFGYTPGVLDKEDLATEQQLLTAMLCRMSVGARQFEIDWDRLAYDATARTRDGFSAWETIAPSYADEAVAGSRRTQPYSFANGATGDYESLARDWPIVLVIGGVIDTFLTHPTAGIESILSVRIRHDAFRREYESAIKQIELGSISKVPAPQAKRMLDKLSPGVYREIQAWLETRMHTFRREKPRAFFNFVPTKLEMSDLLQACVGKTHREIVQIVFNWIQPKIEVHLNEARKSLNDDLGRSLTRRIQLTRDEIDNDAREESVVRRVADALTAAVSRRTSDLDEWFRLPDGKRVASLTCEEIMNAVRQRFQMALQGNSLRWNSLPSVIGERVVKPTHVRLLYDLLSEIINNAQKHSGLDRTTLRISVCSRNGKPFVIFSNKRRTGSVRSGQVEGHPSETLNDALFGDRKSGLQKIAHMAASMIDGPVSVSYQERSSHFHLCIPLGAVGALESGDVE